MFNRDYKKKIKQVLSLHKQIFLEGTIIACTLIIKMKIFLKGSLLGIYIVLLKFQRVVLRPVALYPGLSGPAPWPLFEFNGGITYMHEFGHKQDPEMTKLFLS